MKCADCAYYWKEEDERYAGCHWTIRCPGDIPPCEEEEYDYDESYEPEDMADYRDDMVDWDDGYDASDEM